MSLFDRILPSSALRWGRLTAMWPWVAEHGMNPRDLPPGVIVRCLLGCGACEHELPRPDPAALWGEADRRAEGDG